MCKADYVDNISPVGTRCYFLTKYFNAFWMCGYVVKLNAKLIQCIRANRLDCYKYKSFVNSLLI